MDAQPAVEREFVERRLPWWIAGGALLVYVATMEWSPSWNGLAALARATGWDWHVNLIAPLHQIVTYPIRWLPPALQLWALNATAALSGASALGLLARSVCLLPKNRTPLQRAVPFRQRDFWIPPVFAALICGLELSFWENAVVATGEAFDVMIFAWLINQLLEYRREQKPKRLAWFAFVYGLAVANNYAMIALFPAFLTAYLWTVGRASLRWQVWLRMVGSGSAGLALYLVLPMLTRWSAPDGSDFWKLLRAYWGYQAASLHAFPRYIILLCSLTSLIPVAFIGVAWRGRNSETSAVGRIINSAASLLIPLIFLIAGVTVAFDPDFSPRHLAGGGAALLPLYYLGALAVGYFTEFFLHVLQYPHRLKRRLPPSEVELMMSGTATWALRAGALAVVVALAVKTFPAIFSESAQPMARLSRAAADSLPTEGAVVLSDDLFQLYSLQYQLLRNSPRHRHALVHTAALRSVDYHRFLQKMYPGRWPGFVRQPDRQSPIDAANLMNALLRVEQTSPLYYLQPSFGLFFEFFEARPRGLVYQMVRCPTNALVGPAMSAAEFQQQDAYLQALVSREIKPRIEQASRNPNRRPRTVAGRRLTDYLTEFYSRILNDFGVQLQRARNPDRAAAYFELAVQVNPANVAAFINRAYNQYLRAGKTERGVEAGLAERLKPYEGHCERILALDGPFDEPISCHHLAKSFADTGHYRQAGRELERVSLFSPDNRSAQLDLAMMCIRSSLPDPAEAACAVYRQRFAGGGLRPEEEVELVRIKAWIEALRKNLPSAERLLNAAREQYPKDSLPWDTLVDIYLRFGRQTNAIQVMEQRVQAQPDNVGALVNYGGLKMRQGQLAQALEATERALKIDAAHEDGRFNRALINAALQRWDAAQQDFQTLIERSESKHRLQSLYGLAEVYFRKTNRTESLRYYKEFLKAVTKSGAPPSPEWQTARRRIQTLENQPEDDRLTEPGLVVPVGAESPPLRH